MDDRINMNLHYINHCSRFSYPYIYDFYLIKSMNHLCVEPNDVTGLR